jgi:hypothetical protein
LKGVFVSGSRGDTGKGASKGGKAKPRGKSKPKQKRPSTRGRTKAARERAVRFAPNPIVALIAGDPLKAQIVAVARRRLYSPSEFARDADVKLNVASYTFKVLRQKGVLELVKEEPVKGSAVKRLYRATQDAIIDEEWGDLAEALRPIFTGTIHHDFSERMADAIETGHLYSRDDFCLYWAPGDLDEIAWKEGVELYSWLIEASKQLVVDTANRRAEGKGGDGFHATIAIAFFPSPTESELTKHRAKQGKGGKKSKAKGKRSSKTKKGAKRGKGSKA